MYFAECGSHVHKRKLEIYHALFGSSRNHRVPTKLILLSRAYISSVKGRPSIVFIDRVTDIAKYEPCGRDYYAAVLFTMFT